MKKIVEALEYKKLKAVMKKVPVDIFNGVGLKFLFLASLAITLAVVIYAGANATKIQLNNGDQFVSAAIFGDIFNGAPMVASGHTNIIKIPILWLQAQLPQTFITYTSVNIMFILMSVLLWSFLIGRIFERKYIPLLLLGFSAVIINSPALAIDLSMSTIRHIEYPLALMFLIGLKSSVDAQGRKKIILSVILSILLAALLVNDRLFLYTLVPASIFGSLIYAKRTGSRSLIFSLFPVLTGIILSFVIIKTLNITGLMYVTSGYAEAGRIIELKSLIDALTTTASQTLAMFGGLVFGQEIRKNNISIVMGFVVCVISFVGLYLSLRKENQKSLHPMHTYLGLLMLFTYISYIAPNFVSANNTRYLTGIVFTGLTFFSYAILYWSKKWKYLYILTCVFLVSLIALSIPRIHNFYAESFPPIEKDNVRTQYTIEKLKQEKISTVVAAGGHFSLWFYGKGKLTLAQIEKTCTTPSPWANNSAWLQPKNRQKSAFLVDQSYPELAGRTCSVEKVEDIYGAAKKIIPLPKPGETNDQATSYLLTYDYDIRAKFDTSAIPMLR